MASKGSSRNVAERAFLIKRTLQGLQKIIFSKEGLKKAFYLYKTSEALFFIF